MDWPIFYERAIWGARLRRRRVRSGRTVQGRSVWTESSLRTCLLNVQAKHGGVSWLLMHIAQPLPFGSSSHALSCHLPAVARVRLARV